MMSREPIVDGCLATYLHLDIASSCMPPCKQLLFTLYVVQLVIGCMHTPFTIFDDVSHEHELVSSVCI